MRSDVEGAPAATGGKERAARSASEWPFESAVEQVGEAAGRFSRTSLIASPKAKAKTSLTRTCIPRATPEELGLSPSDLAYDCLFWDMASAGPCNIFPCSQARRVSPTNPPAAALEKLVGYLETQLRRTRAALGNLQAIESEAGEARRAGGDIIGKIETGPAPLQAAGGTNPNRMDARRNVAMEFAEVEALFAKLSVGGNDRDLEQAEHLQHQQSASTRTTRKEPGGAEGLPTHQLPAAVPVPVAVLDTNVLLENLRAVDVLVKLRQFDLVVPGVVAKELDRMQMAGGSEKKNERALKARQACRFLDGVLGNGWKSGTQSDSAVVSTSAAAGIRILQARLFPKSAAKSGFKIESADDEILACALALAEGGGEGSRSPSPQPDPALPQDVARSERAPPLVLRRDVRLVTDDKGLRIKAKNADLRVSDAGRAVSDAKSTALPTDLARVVTADMLRANAARIAYAGKKSRSMEETAAKSDKRENTNYPF